MNLTDMETSVMKCFIEDCFYEEGLESCIWADCFVDTIKRETGIDPKQARGSIASLSKKGYIDFSPMGKDSTLRLAELGKDWLVANKITDRRGRKCID